MPRRPLRFQRRWFGVTTALVLATAIVLMLGVSVAPNLHERLHPTGASLHECAVTLIASGSCESSAQPALIIAPHFEIRFSAIAVLTSSGFKPVLLNAHIFAHAPPGYS